MKRPLNKEERRLEENGLKRNEEILKILGQELEYNKDLIINQQRARVHEDKWKEFLRMRKDLEDAKVIGMMASEVRLTEEKIEIAKRNLKEGVEVKNVQNQTRMRGVG